jgi:hypothetical protein
MQADFTVVGDSDLETPIANAAKSFAARVPVHTGDDIGVYISVTPSNPQCLRSDATYTNHFNGSDVAPGIPTTFTNEPDQIPVAAVLEHDCDNDGLGDESQDTKVSGPACPPTGQRAAAVKRCRKRAQKKHWSGKQLRKCKRKAKRLPV